MATVTVDMRFCDKKSRITVTQREDGDLDLRIETDCESVRSYYKNLGDTLSIDDVTDKEGSRVFDTKVTEPLTMTCMTPLGIVNAAWLELGMLSKSRADKVGENTMIFHRDG